MVSSGNVLRHPRDGGDPLRSGCSLRLNIKNYEYMKQWISACAGMTVLKEINIKHRRHPRDGGDPLRSGCSLRLNIKNDEYIKTVDTGLRRYDGAYVLQIKSSNSVCGRRAATGCLCGGGD